MAINDHIIKATSLLNSPSVKLLRMTERAELYIVLIEEAFSSNSIQVSYATLLQAISKSYQYYKKPLEQGDAKRILNDLVNEGILIEAEGLYQRTDAYQQISNLLEMQGSGVTNTTQSHLLNVQNLCREIVTALNPDPVERKREIRKKIKVLENQLKRIDSGDNLVMSDDQARAQMLYLYESARRLPNDFTKISEDIVSLANELKAMALDESSNRADKLGFFLKQIEQLAASESGRVFTNFRNQLLETEAKEQFDADIKSLLSFNNESRYLNDGESLFLRRLNRRLSKSTLQVVEIRQKATRTLKNFMRLTFDRETIRLTDKITDFKRLASKFPSALNRRDQDIEFIVNETAPQFSIASPIRLSYPEKTIQLSDIGVNSNKTTISLELANEIRSMSITAKEVAKKVVDVINQQGPVTIKEINEFCPIDRGLDEVIGLMRVAIGLNVEVIEKEGKTQNEKVTVYNAKTDRYFSAVVPVLLFTRSHFPDDLDKIRI